MEWKQKKKSSVLRFSFSVEWGLHGNGEVSDVCLVCVEPGARGPGPSGARPYLGECFMERTIGSGLVRMRCQDNCNWSALLKKKSLSTFFSVGLCKVCVSGCV